MIAHERAATKAVIAEVRKEIHASLAARPVEVEIAGRIARIDQLLEKMVANDVFVDRLVRLDARMPPNSIASRSPWP